MNQLKSVHLGQLESNEHLPFSRLWWGSCVGKCRDLKAPSAEMCLLCERMGQGLDCKAQHRVGLKRLHDSASCNVAHSLNLWDFPNRRKKYIQQYLNEVLVLSVHDDVSTHCLEDMKAYRSSMEIKRREANFSQSYGYFIHSFSFFIFMMFSHSKTLFFTKRYK